MVRTGSVGGRIPRVAVLALALLAAGASHGVPKQPRITFPIIGFRFPALTSLLFSGRRIARQCPARLEHLMAPAGIGSALLFPLQRREGMCDTISNCSSVDQQQ